MRKAEVLLSELIEVVFSSNLGIMDKRALKKSNQHCAKLRDIEKSSEQNSYNDNFSKGFDIHVHVQIMDMHLVASLIKNKPLAMN